MSFSTIILAILFEIPNFLMEYIVCCAVEYARPTVKAGSLFLAIGLACVPLGILLYPRYGAINFSMGILATILWSYGVFHHRKWKIVIHAAILLATNILVAALFAFISITVLEALHQNPDEYIGSFNFVYNQKRLIGCIFAPITALIAIPIWYLQRIIHKKAVYVPDGVYLFRSILLLSMSVFAAVMMADLIWKVEEGERTRFTALAYFAAGCMIAIVVTYLSQDIRYLVMRRQKQTLDHEKMITDALITDMRQFRHNIINMIYGYEGVLLFGTLDEQQKYYETMARECARINNENILSLHRIQDSAVSALLLNKLKRAQAMGLPIYLNVPESIRFGHVSSSVLCQVIGVLMDNAIEAAADSLDARVSMLIVKTADGLEFSILNTYRDERAIVAFLSGQNASTKTGHTGDGLKSVEALCRRHPAMSLSKLRKGRFVEVVLMVR